MTASARVQTEPSVLRPWLALRRIRGLGDATCCRLVTALGSPQAALDAAPEVLRGAGLTAAQVEAVRAGLSRDDRRQVDDELRLLDRTGVQVLTYLDDAYPARLKVIHDPPPLLYATGALALEDRQAVALVGTRRPTAAGRLFTEELSRDLAAVGMTIVSGLARGIDGAAHRGALAAHGRTVAVLGCGLDRTYPPEHEGLRRQIEAHGAVLSELPMGAAPHAYHFPRRNRLISGLSLGVVVVEAALRSGSLITARLAAEQGREVFAVPGAVRAETSRGPHGLIKQGAKLVEGAWDVLEELLPQLDAQTRERIDQARPAAKPTAPLSGAQALVADCLSATPTHIDDVIGRTRLDAARVASVLVELELSNIISKLQGNFYIRV